VLNSICIQIANMMSAFSCLLRSFSFLRTKSKETCRSPSGIWVQNNISANSTEYSGVCSDRNLAASYRGSTGVSNQRSDIRKQKTDIFSELTFYSVILGSGPAFG
jgi:hypothetical protein